MAAIAEDGHDCVPRPQLTRHPHGAHAIHCGGASDKEPLGTKQVASHGHRLLVWDSYGLHERHTCALRRLGEGAGKPGELGVSTGWRADGRVPSRALFV